MKIAYISQAYPPIISGVSLTLKRLAFGMAKRGHIVLVLVPSDRHETYIQIYKNLKIVRLKSINNPKRAYQKFVPWSFNSINAYLKTFQPEIIHTHDVVSLGLFGLISGRRLDIPVVATLHQLPWFVSEYLPNFPGLKTSVENLLWIYGRTLNKYYQVMIVPTETISQTVKTHGGFRPKVISNGIDLHHFAPLTSNFSKHRYLCKKYNLDPKLPIILHVGRLDIDKKVDVIVRAAAGVMERIPAQLLVVGDGECRARLIELSRQLHILNNCQFPGFVDMDTDLPDLYRIASVFATASEIETQGLVLLEALASGLPVVAVDATCIHEVVKDQINGYLISQGDKIGITEALIKILQNPMIAKNMGEAGRSIVKSHSSQTSIDEHEKLYSNIVNQYQPAKLNSPLTRFFLHGNH